MLIEIFASILVVSLMSLVGIFTFFFSSKNVRGIVVLFVALSIGALLGDVFIHLIPESLESNNATVIGMLVLLGILVFFLIEKIIKWRHCHDVECISSEHKTYTTMVLIGDSVHNLIDGIIIAAAYIANTPLGFVTTIAIVLHELPQEIGDFGILVHGGYSSKKALSLNFLTALFAFFGAAITIVLFEYIPSMISFLIPFSAGSFIYIAASDLLPELHKNTKMKDSVLQVLAIIFGVFVMFVLKMIIA